MDLNVLFFLSVGLWAILRWVVQPSVHHRFSTRGILRRMGRTATFTLTEQLVRLSAVAAVTAAVLFASVGLLSLLGVSVPGLMVRTIPILARLRDALTSIGEVFGVGGFLLTLGALVVTSCWLGQRDLTERLRQYIAREFERLRQERAAAPESWRSLEPSRDMLQLDAQIEPLLRELDALGPEDPEAPSAEDAARRHLIERLTPLVQSRDLLDYERRIDVARFDQELTLPAAPTLRERVTFFLFSRQLRKDFKVVTRLVSVATLALTVVSLVGLQADALGATLNQSINRLEVKRSAAEAATSWDAATASAPPASDREPAWTDDDDAAATHLAQAYLRAVASSRVWRVSELHPRVEALSRSRDVRRAILGAPHVPAAAERASVALGEVESELLAKAEAVGDDRAAARVAEEIKRDIRRHAADRPSAWARIRPRITEHLHGYGKVAPLGEVHAQLIKDVIGSAMDVVPLDASTPTGKLAARIAGNVGQDVVADVVRLELRRTLVRLHAGDSLESALHLVRVGRPAAAPLLRLTASQQDSLRRAVSEDHLVTALRERMPTAAPTAETRIDRARVETAARRILRTTAASGASVDTRVTLEALASYDDYFPGQYRAEERTLLGTLDDSARAGAPGGSAPGPASNGRGPRARASAPVRADAVVTAARARSFKLARGFARVGGVLIGQEPRDGTSGPQLTDLTWRVTGDQVRLALRDARGHEVGLGPHPVGVVNQALRYAADGRVTTVTMTTASPLLELKILLHPVLLDTPLGCAAIELDRLVDTFARQDPKVRTAEEVVQDEYALYRLAWAHRQAALGRVAGSSGARLAAQAERELGDARLRARVRRALMTASLGGPPDRSLLLSRPEYFDAEIVRHLKEVTARTREVEALERSLRAHWEERARALLAREDGAMIRGWVGAPATFEVWSGVREAPYEVDPALGFVRRPAEALAPFRFIVQLSFTSEPAFGTTTETFFEIAAAQPRIQQLVAAGVGRSPAETQAVRRMQEFALLQRLFRVALDGGLGPAFPIEKLQALARATDRSKEMMRTPRWNFRPGLLEQNIEGLVSRGLADPRIAADAPTASALRRCAAFVEAARNGGTPAGGENACEVGAQLKGLASACEAGGSQAACDRFQILQAVAELAHGVELRRALNVSAEEEQARSGRGCPVIAR